jgi:hypothetical protein
LRLLECFAELSQEVPRQRLDLDDAIPEGRNAHREAADAIVQIGAKSPVP